MLPRSVRPALAILAAIAVAAVTAATASGTGPPGGYNAGPPYNYTTELVGQFKFIPLKDQAILEKTKHGYRFRTGQQTSHTVVTLVDHGRGLRIVDSGTKRFKSKASSCRRLRVRRGIGAVCRVPATISVRRPLLVEVWPRLGNDYTDGSSLPATVAMTVLGDEGHDTALTGSGPDFVNGHSGRDRTNTGAGNDWIRAGLDNDPVIAGSGNDYIVGMEGSDGISAGPGNDRVYGSEGGDVLRGNAGRDFLSCGPGRDRAMADRGDTGLGDCESVRR